MGQTAFERNGALDRGRVAAAIAVVWLHVAAAVVGRGMGAETSVWWFGNVADAAARWCVPVFVMISGALLLDGEPARSLTSFYRRRASRLLPPLAFWTVFYWCYEALRTRQVNGSRLLQGFIEGVPHGHLWFLYMLMGLYVVAPFVHGYLAQAPARHRQVLILTCLIMTSVDSTVAAWQGDTSRTFISLFVPFLGYFMAGHELTKVRLWPRRKLWALVLLSSVLIAGVAGALVPSMGSKAWAVMYHYLNPLVVVQSLAVFGLILQSSPRIVANNWTSASNLAGLSLGVYVLHPVWLAVLHKVGLNGLTIHPVVGIPLVTALTVALAGAATAVLLRLPGLRRTVS